MLSIKVSARLVPNALLNLVCTKYGVQAKLKKKNITVENAVPLSIKIFVVDRKKELTLSELVVKNTSLEL
jgi:hypothetical protein